MKKAEAVMVRVIGIGDNVCDKYEHLKTMFPGGQPPHLVEAIDTLGAGDSFATAFLLSLTQSRKEYRERMDSDRKLYRQQLKEAMEKGASFAAATCLVQGAFGRGRAF